MTKQDLEDAELATLTVEEARNLDVENDALSTAIDNAQAKVFGGDQAVAYVIVEIRA